MPQQPFEHYEIAEMYLGTRDNPGGIWADLPKSRVFDSGSEGTHTRRSIAFEAAGRYVVYTVDYTRVTQSRGLWGECVVLDPSQQIATDQVVVADRFTVFRYRMDLPELRHWILQGGAEPVELVDRFLEELMSFAVQDTTAFIASLHPPAGAGVDTRLSVPTVSGGRPGSKRSH